MSPFCSSRLSGSSIFCAVVAVSHVGCGLVADGSGSEHGDGDGDLGSDETCLEGEQRLSNVECSSGGFSAEECVSGDWSPAKECLEPDAECLDGDSSPVETDSTCGEHFFNRVLEGCSGSLFQELGCTCGSPDPIRPEKRLAPDEKGDLTGAEGNPFPDELFLGYHGYRSDLSHVRCVDQLYSYGSPIDLPGLRGVRELIVADERALQDGEPIETALDLGSLRRAEYLDINYWPEKDLRALSSLEEVHMLEVACPFSFNPTYEQCPTLVSLEGLEGVSRLRSAWIEVPTLTNLQGLNNLRVVDSWMMVLADYSEPQSGLERFQLASLEGLNSLQEVGDSLHLPIQTEDDIDVLGKLTHVGQNLDLIVEDELICSLPRLLDHVRVDGEVIVNFEPLDLSACR